MVNAVVVRTDTPPVVMLINLPASDDATLYAPVWLLTGTVRISPMLSVTVVPAVSAVVVVRAAPIVALPALSRTMLVVLPVGWIALMTLIVLMAASY